MKNNQNVSYERGQISIFTVAKTKNPLAGLAGSAVTDIINFRC